MSLAASCRPSNEGEGEVEEGRGGWKVINWFLALTSTDEARLDRHEKGEEGLKKRIFPIETAAEEVSFDL